MNNLTVYIKSMNPDIPGFNEENNFTLKFMLPNNSFITDLLNNLNQYRMPKNMITILHDINGNKISNEKLKDERIYLIL